MSDQSPEGVGQYVIQTALSEGINAEVVALLRAQAHKISELELRLEELETERETALEAERETALEAERETALEAERISAQASHRELEQRVANLESRLNKPEQSPQQDVEPPLDVEPQLDVRSGVKSLTSVQRDAKQEDMSLTAQVSSSHRAVITLYIYPSLPFNFKYFEPTKAYVSKRPINGLELVNTLHTTKLSSLRPHRDTAAICQGIEEVARVYLHQRGLIWDDVSCLLPSTQEAEALELKGHLRDRPHDQRDLPMYLTLSGTNIQALNGVKLYEI